jgi:hypothetical protein
MTSKRGSAIKRIRTVAAFGLLFIAFGATPSAQADIVCSPAWGHGLPQVCVDIPVQAQSAPAFVADGPPGR